MASNNVDMWSNCRLIFFTGNPEFRVTVEHMENGKSKLHCSVIGSTFWGHVNIQWYDHGTNERVVFPLCGNKPFSDGSLLVSCEYECPTYRIQEPICRIEYGGRKEALTVDGAYDERVHTPRSVMSEAMIIILGMMAACGIISFSVVTTLLYIEKQYSDPYEHLE